MKRLVLLLLLTIASACSAQVETGGLRIPGEDAVQVMKKSAFTPHSLNGLVLELYAENYSDPGAGQPSVWLDTSGYGNDASCTYEASKPVVLSRTYGDTVASKSISVVLSPSTRSKTFTHIAFVERAWNTTSDYVVWNTTHEDNKYSLFTDYSNNDKKLYYNSAYVLTLPAYVNATTTAFLVARCGSPKKTVNIISALDNYTASLSTGLADANIYKTNIGGSTVVGATTSNKFYCWLSYNRVLTDQEVVEVIAWLKTKYGVIW